MIEYRDVPAVAARLQLEVAEATPASCSARIHFTGDIRVHDIAFAGGELWLVATRFSCLATLDAEHSFVPRWRPPFVTALAAEDRCHLNGLAVVDDRVRYVTALGATDAPGGWREDKAARRRAARRRPSARSCCRGLSMPHSPRWHDGRLWLLESGEGTLAVVDLATGTRGDGRAAARLHARPGASPGGYAFVGLSQVREATTFGGLPLTARLGGARSAGSGSSTSRPATIVGFLRFEDVVQEVFDVAVLAGRRFPEVAEPGSEAATLSYVVPPMAAAP